MRLQEILQLYVTDIYHSQDHWVIDLNEAHEDKRLKTGQSKRVIPMHPDLVQIGLTTFKKSQEEKGSERLFPDAIFSGDGTYSSTYSKWFSRYLQNIGIKTVKTSFHSFRHNMKDFFRAAGISEESSEHYLGRSTGKTGEAYDIGHTVESFATGVAETKASDYLSIISFYPF